VVALAGALTAGTLPRWRQQRAVDAAAAEAAAAPPRVTVAAARRYAPEAERVLPGNCLPLLEAAVFARTNGYVKRRLVDIGDRVREGQLLAEIATPEIDAQLEQARAALLQARANLVRDKANEVFAKAEEQRTLSLLRTGGAAAQEEYDSRVAAAQVATATVHATEATIKVDEANVLRLTTLQSFQKLTAPFPGVITARNVDPGDLVSADSPNTTRELFHLMRTDVLRVFVNLPQVFAPGVKAGQGADVYRRDDPQKFPGRVTRTADALDPNTRTLLTEVQVPNPDNTLRPGMYLQVRFAFARDVLPVVIPAAALAPRTGGPRVAVLDDQRRVRYRAVQLGRDFGAEIAVTAGLNAGETVVVHPGDDLPEGMAVEPVPVPGNPAGT
jgi:RND family efflux transporter MFP subunit